jgi:pimeloyl-ACP methyl ester carboxylesterase
MRQFAPNRRARLPAIHALQTRRGRIGYVLSGRGKPSIVLFSGAGVSLQGWEPLYPGIARISRVLGWNRFGIEGSDAPRGRQSGAVVLGALRELLRHAELAPPYVLVAHSMGGLFANLYARLYPREVAAVALIEATHPADRAVLGRHGPQMERALGKLLSLPGDAFRANLHGELAGIDEVVREIEAAGPFPEVPLRVITGGLTPRAWQMSPAAVGARRAHQQELARLSPLGEQVIAHRSGHFPQWTQPHLVLRVVHELVMKVRP